MKLHVYDHCPYCVRARMPLGLKAIPAEVVYQDNDDEETPIRMIGAKMLPILEDQDGYMGESLDIVHKLDALDGTPIFGGPVSPEIEAWLARWSGTISKLVTPRTPDPVYPEFRTESARAYFTRKKTASHGDFPALLAQTDDLLAELSEGLAALCLLLPDPTRPSLDDIVLFPVLRSLTVLPDLVWPDPVAAYAKAMSQASGVPLVSDMRARQMA